METQTQLVKQPLGRSGEIFSFLISFVVHLGLLIILACWAYMPGRAGQGMVLTGEIDSSEEIQLDLSANDRPEPVEADLRETVGQPEFEVKLDFDVELDAIDESAGHSVIAAISASARSSAFASGRSSEGEKQGAAFFGAYAEGERFVYVIDSSTSMTGDRWLYACSQLIDSLQQLRADQEFYVISFDVKPSFMFSRGPNPGNYLRNEPKTIAKVRAWLKTKILGRGTRPAKALEFALSMKPDAIFLLSDGELQDNTVFQLRLLNRTVSSRSQIPIHAVHLFSMDGRATLELIAFENSGSFTPVEGR